MKFDSYFHANYKKKRREKKQRMRFNEHWKVGIDEWRRARNHSGDPDSRWTTLNREKKKKKKKTKKKKLLITASQTQSSCLHSRTHQSIADTEIDEGETESWERKAEGCTVRNWKKPIFLLILPRPMNGILHSVPLCVQNIITIIKEKYIVLKWNYFENIGLWSITWNAPVLIAIGFDSNWMARPVRCSPFFWETLLESDQTTQYKQGLLFASAENERRRSMPVEGDAVWMGQPCCHCVCLSDDLFSLLSGFFLLFLGFNFY